MVSGLLNVPLLVFIFLGFLVIPIMFLKGARWQFIASGLNLRIRTTEATEALCISQMVNLTLPGNIGDLIRVPYLKARGNPSDRSVISLLIDAIVAAIIPFTFGILALIFLLPLSITIESVLVLVIWVIGFFITYIILKRTLWPWFLEARLSQMMNEGVTDHLVFTIPKILKQIKRRKLVAAVLVTTLSWLLFSFQALILAQALGITVSWFYLAVSLGAVTIFTSIPISINGLGVREGVLLVLLGLLGFSPDIVVSFSISLMLLNLTPSLAGIFLWMRDPFTKLSALTNPKEILGVEESLKLEYQDSEFYTL